MISRDPMRNPVARARNWGSAKSGAHHAIIQRVTAVALALLTPWVLWLMFTAIPGDYETVRAILASPVHAVLMLAFVISLFWHARLGVQVVVDDYVHHSGLNITLQVITLFVFTLAALASLLAVGRIFLAV